MEIGLIELLKKIEKEKQCILMEPRYEMGYRIYSIINHGEVRGYINLSDGDLWDVVIPGYKCKLKKREYMSNEILGLFILNNGNSKIFMRVCEEGYDNERAVEDIKKYIKEYLYWNDVEGEWVEYKKFKGRL